MPGTFGSDSVSDQVGVGSCGGHLEIRSILTLLKQIGSYLSCLHKKVGNAAYSSKAALVLVLMGVGKCECSECRPSALLLYAWTDLWPNVKSHILPEEKFTWWRG